MKIIRAIKSYHLVYAGYVITIFLFCNYANQYFGDDIVWISENPNVDIIPEVVARYFGWSSRVFIDIVMLYLIKHGLLYWKIINFILFSTLPYFLSKLTDSKNKSREIGLLMVCLYPMLDMASCGWIACTTNYAWPLWALVFIAFVVRKSYYKQKIHFTEWIIAFISLIYGACHEITSVFMVLIFFIYGYSLLRKKERPHIIVGILFLINLIELFFILLSPGNQNRTRIEAETYMPGFEDFSIFDKLYLGIMNVMKYFISSYSMIFITFIIVLSILVWLKTNNGIKTIISLIPLVINLFYLVVPKLKQDNNIGYKKNWLAYYRPKIKEMTEIPEFGVDYIPIFYFVLIVLCVGISLYFICKDDILSFIYLLLIVGMGMASAVIMGFSPTIYASVTRPFIYINFTMIYVIQFCVDYVERHCDYNIAKINELYKVLLFLLIIFAIDNSFITIKLGILA